MSASSVTSINSHEFLWPTPLPEGWKLSPLKALFHIVGGSTPKSDNEENWGGTIVWVTPTDLTSEGIALLSTSQRTITEVGLASCATTLVPPGSIVLSTRAPIGSLGIADVELCTNQGCKSLVPRDQSIDSHFYALLLSTMTEQLRVRGKGTTFLELSSDELGAVRVPVPPHLIQVAIVHYLSQEIRKIDALIDEQNLLIHLLKERRSTLISAAATGKINVHQPDREPPPADL